MTAGRSNRENMPPDQAARKVIDVLRDAGHTALLAGGCVRDRLLGIEPKDYDVATDAPPERVVELFHRAQLVGEAFGVALVRIGGQPIEVATFREEWGYSDGRRPDSVKYSDAPHDAQRRDFTINGLFCDVTGTSGGAAFQDDPVTKEVQGLGTVIDFVGGLADLEAERVRAIGSPGKRFSEDYLRMLRAVRFAARLGFEIEADTATAIRLHAGKLSEISRERIGQEVQAMLTPSHAAVPTQRQSDPARAVDLMQSLGIDGPTLMEPKQSEPVRVVDHLNQSELPEPGFGYASVLAAWLLDRAWCSDARAQHDRDGQGLRLWLASGEPGRVVKRWRKALNLSNDQTQALTAALSGLETALRWPELRVAHRKRLLARANWPDVAGLVDAVGRVTGFDAWRETVLGEAEALLAHGVAPDPLLDGQDLIDAGLKPGPTFGRLLDEAYSQQLEGELADRDAALAWLKRQKTA